MDRTELLEALKARQEEVGKDLLMPTKPQKGIESIRRPSLVYNGRLPDETSSTTKAPYTLNCLVSGSFGRDAGQPENDRCVIRTVMCVYNPDGTEGTMALINLMERYRISLQKDPILDHTYELDLKARIQDLVYPDDTAPFYMGEMYTEWILPPVEREVQQWL